ncbi:membrane protein [Marmoricola endophyticus]|uniref:Membrane protein n=1 Tax=Marmoricola endophyticus TaxID=2040280 RepID=A0A917BIY6_9ACTN|nr:ArsB/NhaD family transporter [Marmoricola endophyticus]GGF41414.1 membrane protein [Marmoricola endophyticus]
MSLTHVLALVVFVGAYALIASEKVNRTAAALGGAALMLALGLTDGEAAFYSETSGVDWNVVFLLFAMMVIVGVLKRTGLFEAMAIYAAKRARGRPFPVLVLLIAITGIASAMLDNVTTVLLVAPVTFVVCERLGLDVVPYLVCEVLASNIGGAATLIGDPPNIIIGSRSGLDFNDFLLNLAPFALGMLVVLVLLVRVMFRRTFVYDAERAAEVMALSEREAIRDPKLLAQSLVVLVLVMAGFVLGPVIGKEPSTIALLGAGLLVLVSSVTVEDAIADVEWETLVFFMGLFVMVGALVETGIIGDLAEQLAKATGGNLTVAVLLLLLASLLLSGVVDNIPYVATMAPIVVALTADVPGSGDGLWWALALGADLGGNATAVGASANVVVIGMARRYGTPISFWRFTRYGATVTLASGLLAVPYLLLRYT